MPMSYFGLGMLRLRQGRYREAETSLQTFVKLEPARREGYDRLAREQPNHIARTLAF